MGERADSVVKTDENIVEKTIESTTYKFAKSLQRRFGIIKGITDKDYVTNSYHITPSQNIDAFSKLTYESEFQQYSQGGYFKIRNSCSYLKFCEPFYSVGV